MLWLKFLAYAIAAAASGECGRRKPERARERKWWLGLAALLVALGANKAMHLEIEAGELLDRAVSPTAKTVAQVSFLGVVAVAAVLLLAQLGTSGRYPTSLLVGLAGAGVLLGMVALRAASIHAIDQLFGRTLAGIPLSWPIEATGLGLITVGALVGIRRG